MVAAVAAGTTVALLDVRRHSDGRNVGLHAPQVRCRTTGGVGYLAVHAVRLWEHRYDY